MADVGDEEAAATRGERESGAEVSSKWDGGRALVISHEDSAVTILPGYLQEKC